MSKLDFWFICAVLCTNRILLSLMFVSIMRLNHVFSVYSELSLFLFHILALTGREQEVLKAHIGVVGVRPSVRDLLSV